LRFASYALFVVVGLIGFDAGGHIFVTHGPFYWSGLIMFLILASAWNDLFFWREPVQAASETRRTKAMRIFYQAVFMFVFLAALDRSVDLVFVKPHSLRVWILLAVIIAFLAGWYDLARSGMGQRILSSIAVERITLTGTSLVIILVIFELFVRSEFSRFHVLGIFPTWEVYTDPNIAFHTNSANFRDREHTVEKQPGVTRIVVLGDSFASGQGVAQTDYLPARLQELAGPSYEVIAVARPAAETFNQVEFMRDYACQFKAEIVVVAAFTNDPYLGRDRNIPPWPAYFDVFKKLESPYSFNPQLMYVFDNAINRAACNSGRYCYDDWLAAIYDPAQNPGGIEKWHSIVRDLADEAKVCGAQSLYAFTLPEPVDYNDPATLSEFTNIHVVLAEGFIQAGFDTLNLLPAYIEYFGSRPARTLWALPNDFHANAEIHQWYAEQIWAKLKADQ
jgi:hypothetical protein